VPWRNEEWFDVACFWVRLETDTEVWPRTRWEETGPLADELSITATLQHQLCASPVDSTLIDGRTDGRTDEEPALLGLSRVERRTRRNQLRPRTDRRKSAAGDWLSARDTSARVRMPVAAAAEYIIKQTARASRATLAERQCVGLDYRAVRRRTPDRFRSYLAPPALPRRPGAPTDVTRSCPGSGNLPSLIYRRRATRRRQRCRLTGSKSARHRRGLSARSASVATRFTTKTRYFLRLCG